MLGNVVYTVRSTPKLEFVEEFNRWQIEEHVPNLLTVPGYHGVLRFRCVDDTRLFMNVWDIESREPFDSDLRYVASHTPWKDRIAPVREKHLVDFYENGVKGFSAGIAADRPIRGLLRYDLTPDDAGKHRGITSAALEKPEACAVRVLHSTTALGEIAVLVYLSEKPAGPRRENDNSTRFERINGFDRK